MISIWKSSVALIQLIALSDKTPGTSLMIFIQFVTDSVLRSSVGWKPTVVEVLDLLPDRIDWALSILSVNLTSSVSCISFVAGRAAKSEDSCDASEPPAVHWLEDTSSESSFVRCVSITSDARDAIRS